MNIDVISEKEAFMISFLVSHGWIISEFLVYRDNREYWIKPKISEKGLNLQDAYDEECQTQEDIKNIIE